MIIHPTGKFDNSARDYRFIESVPLAAAMGAEIRGVQVAAIDEATFAEIEDALFRHKMIFFRDQSLSHSEHEAFSARFGPFAEDAYTRGIEGHENVQQVIRQADDRTTLVFGSGWHTDSQFLEQPPAISLLYGVDIPPYGGDTQWANSVLAYALLSPKMQSIVDDLKVCMSMKNVLTVAQQSLPSGDPLLASIEARMSASYHPLVRTHPRSGEKALYCDKTYTVGIEGMHDDEAETLLRFLGDHVSQSAFTCRLRWQPRTLALWDNRLCLHRAFNDYEGFRRELYRTTIAGETPQ
jgi:taurine dioxygenase